MIIELRSWSYSLLYGGDGILFDVRGSERCYVVYKHMSRGIHNSSHEYPRCVREKMHVLRCQRNRVWPSQQVAGTVKWIPTNDCGASYSNAGLETVGTPQSSTIVYASGGHCDDRHYECGTKLLQRVLSRSDSVSVL